MNLSRRGILKTAAMTLAVAPFLGLLDLTKAFAQAAGKALIDMTGKKRKDPVNKAAVAIAKNLNYIQDHGKEKAVGGMDKASAKGTKFAVAQQYCNNCQYAPDNVKPAEGYSCLLIANVLVHHNGWCKQWNPRAQD